MDNNPSSQRKIQDQHDQNGRDSALPCAAPAPLLKRVARGTTVDPYPGTSGLGVEQKAGATAGIRVESFGKQWSRRAITIPVTLFIIAAVTVATPVALLAAFLVDAIRREPWIRVRFVLVVNLATIGHFIGGIGLIFVWVFSSNLFGGNPERRLRWNRRLEGGWTRTMLNGAMRIYDMRVEVGNLNLAHPGPVLLASRHASVIDTILPMYLLEEHGMLMRVVKKFELIFDPCIDAISHRVPRAFVKRSKGAAKDQIEALQRLTEGMDHDDAVVIFPEGTRFTAAKKAEVMPKLRARRPELARRSESLRHLLPVRTAGTFALLDARSDLDVVFMAHTGLEGANRLEHFIGGVLYQKVLKVEFWRVPAEDVPTSEEARIDWLCQWWQTIDDWVDANRQRPN